MIIGYQSVTMRVSKSVLVGKYSADQVDQVVSLYETLGQQYRWSSAVKRMPLVFLQGNKSREAAESYIRLLFF